MSAPDSLARLAELTRMQCDRAAARLAEAQQQLAQAEAQQQRVSGFVDEYGATSGGTRAWQLANRAGFRQRLDQALAQQTDHVAALRQRRDEARHSWETAYRACRSLTEAAEQQRARHTEAREQNQRRHEDTRMAASPWRPAWT